MKKIFSRADILMPSNVNMETWSVVACDQHTSDKQYWQTLKDFVGNNPSTLNMIVPEAYLGENNKALIENANNNMFKILNTNILNILNDSIIYVERGLSNGKIRKGIIGKIDLDEYSCNIKDEKFIKPSEEIVESRVPIRVDIRKNASLDIPHILLFCDDKNKKIIEPLNKIVTEEQKIYDFTLNMNGGNIVGYKLNEEQTNSVEEEINNLITNSAGLMVADGNHSLVAAKCVYEEVKKTDKDYLNSPKRYALVEIVNIYDEAIEIEPIHRVIKNVDCNDLIENIKKLATSSNTKVNSENSINIICKTNTINIPLNLKANELTVEVIQKFLDEYLSTHNGEIDYIHELDKLENMCKENNTLGIQFAPIVKNEIFGVIANKKVFPRKTFSIGTSLDKRYYLECRKLIK